MKIFTRNINTFQNKGLKVIVLSDLHIFDLKDVKKLDAIMNLLSKNEYDAIFLVGDILDCTNLLVNDSITKEQLFLFMRCLGCVAPTYFVYGSHDIGRYNFETRKWTNDFSTFREEFCDVVSGYRGINILNNETKDLGNGYTVSGFNPSFKYAYNKPNGDDETLLIEGGFEFLDNLTEENTNMLLCHYPNVFNVLNNYGYLENVNLGIAGHNHNGMTQLRFFPIETILDLLGHPNRGLITPVKSMDLEETEHLRGMVNLNERSSIVINPAVTSLAACTGFLRNFENMFYSGATEINYVLDEEMKLQRKSLDN